MITDDRRGEVALRRRLRALAGLEVRAGVLQPDPTREGDTTIAVVAAAHEFGTRTVPQRSFIARTVDGKAAEIGRLQEAVIERVLDGADPEDAADLAGLGVASLIRDTIRSNVPPPLSAATAERKQDTRTLVDTGQLLNAIKHEVGRADADS